MNNKSLTPERSDAIRAEWRELKAFYIQQWDPEEAGAYVAGVLLGARLMATSPTVCAEVLATIEADCGVAADVAPETVEIHTKTIVDNLVSAGVPA